MCLINFIGFETVFEWSEISLRMAKAAMFVVLGEGGMSKVTFLIKCQFVIRLNLLLNFFLNSVLFNNTKYSKGKRSDIWYVW